MSEIVRSHCEMLLPDTQRAQFCARLADHLAAVLSKQSKFDALVAMLPELSLEDMLTLSLVANDGVVLFSAHPAGAVAARFVPITEGEPESEPEVEPEDTDGASAPGHEDDFERELAALTFDD